MLSSRETAGTFSVSPPHALRARRTDFFKGRGRLESSRRSGASLPFSAGAALVACRSEPVEGKIELQNIDVRLADDAGDPRLDVRVDQVFHGGLAQTPRLGDARRLEISRRRRDVRVEAARRRGHE